LTNDAWRTHLAQSIDEANQELDVRLVAFVFMPEHVHLLIEPSQHEYDISRHLARIKQPLSKKVKASLVAASNPLLDRLTVRERPGKSCFRFWQEGSGFDRNLFTPEAIRASIDYIHRNPVVRGLCQRAIDWRWSSARFYLAETLFQQYDGLPKVQRIRVDSLQ